MAFANIAVKGEVVLAKRRYGMTERKIAKFRKQGRGEGRLASYRPWLTIHDVASFGLSSRIPGAKTGRLHHLLSQIERDVFHECDWDERVTDIREQFPLDRAETVTIAEAMGVRHPSDCGVDVVMTTDLLVDHVAGGVAKLTAIAVKLAGDLEDERTLEKLEIERRYWTARGVPYFVMTQREASEQRARNIGFFGERRDLGADHEVREGYRRDVCEGVLAALGHATGGSLIDVLSAAERAHGWAVGDALAATRHLVANRRLGLDMDVAFDARMPASGVRLLAPRDRKPS